MNLTIDRGNTADKWATFEGRRMTDHGTGVPEGLIAEADRVLCCVSGQAAPTIGGTALPLLSGSSTLPIRLDYKTPATLGADRIADACGAWALHPNEPSLIIDAGTCITVDFIDGEGVYHGGAIMPGLTMCLRALNEHTARLPLVELKDGDRAGVVGRSTEESIKAGTLGATTLALAGFVALYRQKAPRLNVLLTGGDAHRLAANTDNGWEHVDNLALIGLNECLLEMENRLMDNGKSR